MIPQLTPHGYLPPYIGHTPAASANMAPYKASLLEFATAFATTPVRIEAFRGLLELREMLRSEGITQGFQWIDGSFVENCELLRSRAPNDIDVVTFLHRPIRLRKDEDWHAFLRAGFLKRFDRKILKESKYCDAYFEDLDLPGFALASKAKYWFGLFSHQKITGMWKGLVEVPLTENDSDVWNWVNSESSP